MIFAGIIGFLFVTVALTGLVLKGNGDSLNNYF